MYAFRLKPGDDLYLALEEITHDQHIQASCVLTCVGSLTVAILRLANHEEYTTFEGHFEIVSLTGTLSAHGSHLHISISDPDGHTIGGHLVEGCKIYTTAEIVIGAFPDLVFVRQPCQLSGYDELVVQSV
jgi:predicted DNA-binding protein with PD1-like motif